MDCNGCTLCCELLEIPWMDSPAGKACRECSIGVGCKIWDNIPKKCKEYSCAYNQAENVPEGLRPDKCGVIFEKIGDKMFFGTKDIRRPMTEFAAGQMIAFRNQGFSVVINGGDGILTYILGDGHTLEEIKEELHNFQWRHTEQTLQH